MKTLDFCTLGNFLVKNPDKGQPPFLSAASALSISKDMLRSVGDDQASIVEYPFNLEKAVEAVLEGRSCDLLVPGRARKILRGLIPTDERRFKEKPDFESMATITPEHLMMIQDPEVSLEAADIWPYGLMMTAGSGSGDSRRSMGVVYTLTESGRVIGLPREVVLEDLHTGLRPHVHPGRLNIEGMCAHNDELVFAQRGNSENGINMLMRVKLAKAIKSMYTDFKIDECELLEEPKPYELGHREVEVDGVTYKVPLDFTDLDEVKGDPRGRLIATAAAEGREGPVKGKPCGSAVYLIEDWEIVDAYAMSNPNVKLEGVDPLYLPGSQEDPDPKIVIFAASDADDPEIPAPLFGAWIPA